MTTPKPLPHHDEQWKGYTLDELRYARAYTAARIEINRERVRTRIGRLGTAGKKSFAPSGMVRRVIGAMSYIDIALLVWKVSSQSFRLIRNFRK